MLANWRRAGAAVFVMLIRLGLVAQHPTEGGPHDLQAANLEHAYHPKAK